jgi:hypothetical protein
MASILAGLAESGVLAIIAQVAASLVNGTSRLPLSFGPLHVVESRSALLIIGALLAAVRLALQGVLSAVPAKIVDDFQARLRTTLFAA